MEEEILQGGVCGGNLWNPPRNLFASSPCSSAVNGGVGSFGWSNHGVAADVKAATDSGGGCSAVQKPHHLADWKDDSFHESGRSQEKYSYILEALNSSMNCRMSNFYADSSSMISNQSFPTQQNQPNSFTSNYVTNFFDEYSQYLLDYHQMNSSQLIDLPHPPKLQPPHGNSNFHFINNTPFWNAAGAAPPAPSFGSQLVPSSLGKANAKHRSEKIGNESANKRPRTETPSPMPAFKVRKEKLGDRVTALQQLVSPFGKTDTASVLHEAIEYIKLLHDQVTVLSTPYLRNGCPPLQCQKDQEETTKDLRSRGLCLVPIASTFPVAAETSPDFWAPTFGGTFR